MKNSNDYILNLLKTISPDEKIEINSLGEIKVIHRDIEGKKKSKKMGNLFRNMEESPIVKFRTTSFVSINTPALKSYRDFGKKESSRIPKDYEIDVITGIFEMLLDTIPVIPGNFTDSNHIKYETKKVGEYTGFYAYNRLYFILFEGKKYLIPNHPDKLETHTFKSIDEVK